MKKTIFPLAMMLIGISLSASAASTEQSCNSANTVCTHPTVSIVSATGIFDLTKLNGTIVEQTVTFANGKTATVYYKIEDGSVSVFSETDLSHYTLDDLLNVKESKERKVSAAKGKCYGTYTLKEARRIAAKWLGL